MVKEQHLELQKLPNYLYPSQMYSTGFSKVTEETGYQNVKRYHWFILIMHHSLLFQINSTIKKFLWNSRKECIINTYKKLPAMKEVWLFFSEFCKWFLKLFTGALDHVWIKTVIWLFCTRSGSSMPLFKTQSVPLGLQSFPFWAAVW